MSVDLLKLQQHAEQGDVPSMLELAKALLTDQGGETVDEVAAVHWYIAAAEAGHSNNDAALAAACTAGLWPQIRRLLQLVTPCDAFSVTEVQHAFLDTIRRGDVRVLRELLSEKLDFALGKQYLKGVLLNCLNYGDTRVASELYAVCGSLDGYYVPKIDTNYAYATAALLKDVAVQAEKWDQSATETEFVVACRHGNVSLCEAILKGDSQKLAVGDELAKAFYAACSGGQLRAVKRLLLLTGKLRIDVHTQGEAAFRVACASGHVSVVRELLALDGDRLVDVKADSSRFASALEESFELFESDFVLDPRQQSYQLTGLTCACFFGHHSVVQELLSLPPARRPAIHQMHFQAAAFAGHCGIMRDLLTAAGPLCAELHARSEAAFKLACLQGHLPMVIDLLALTGQHHVDASACITDGFTLACANGHFGIVCELLALEGDRHVDVHSGNEAALLAACQGGHLPVVSHLLTLDGGRRMGIKPEDSFKLVAACTGGEVSVVRALLALTDDRRIDVRANSEAAFTKACSCGHIDVVRELLSLGGDRRVDVHANKEAAFRAACKFGHLDVMRELLALKGARYVDVHANGESALCMASLRGYTVVVQELLALTEDRQLYTSAQSGLMEKTFANACCHSSTEVVQLLLDLKGARHVRVTAQDEWALRLACERGSVSVAKLLLGLGGADASSLHCETKTSEASCKVMRAAGKGGFIEVADELLKAKHSGATLIFQSACAAGHVPLVRHLLQWSLSSKTVDIDVNADKAKALFGACKNGHTEVVCELLQLTQGRLVDASVSNGRCFVRACAEGHLAVVRELLMLTGDRAIRQQIVNGDSPALTAACRGGHVEVIMELIQARDKATLPATLAWGHDAMAAACECAKAALMGIVLCGFPVDWMPPVPAPVRVQTRNRYLSQAVKNSNFICKLLQSGTVELKDEAASAWRAVAAPTGLMQHPDARPELQAAAKVGHKKRMWLQRQHLLLHRAVLQAK